MPNQIATATNHKDMLNKLRVFATGMGTFPTPGYAGTGDGVLSHVQPKVIAVDETWTIVCTTGGGHGVAIFSVTGSVSGAQAALTVGTFYENTLIEMNLVEGAIDFVASDVFTIVVTEGEMTTISQAWIENRYASYRESTAASDFVSVDTLFDNDPDTVSTLVGTEIGVLHLEFGVAVDLIDYTIHPQVYLFDATILPKDWTWEYSDDGINWDIADTVIGKADWTSTPVTFEYASVGRHIFWRLNQTENNGNANTEIAKLECTISGQLVDCMEFQHLLLKGIGLSGADEIFLGYSIYENALTPYFNWRLNGYVAYDASEPFDNQPGQNNLWTNQPMDNSTIGYWLVCTGRKIVCVTKVGIRYTNSYMGFILPYALPSEYPYPLLIAANVQTLSEPVSSSTDRYRMMVNPGYKAVHLRDPGGAWIWFAIWAGVGSETVHADRITWPYGSVVSTTWALTSAAKMRDSIDGSYAILPVILHQSQADGNLFQPNTWGEYDGCHYVSGFGNAAENTFSIDGDDYVVFPDIFRTDNDNYFALRMD